jgi:hypothetical protein
METVVVTAQCSPELLTVVQPGPPGGFAIVARRAEMTGNDVFRSLDSLMQTPIGAAIRGTGVPDEFIRNLFVRIDSAGNATAYVNPSIDLMLLTRRRPEDGMIAIDDVAEVGAARFRGVASTGAFSTYLTLLLGFRRGVLFDADVRERPDLSRDIASIVSRLLFDARVDGIADVKEAMANRGWFRSCDFLGVSSRASRWGSAIPTTIFYPSRGTS